MTLTIMIEMDNAAFCHPDSADDDTFARAMEAARILKDFGAHLASRLGTLDSGDSGKLRDVNGNTVGRWEVSE